jgi:hypothetical protein
VAEVWTEMKLDWIKSKIALQTLISEFFGGKFNGTVCFFAFSLIIEAGNTKGGSITVPLTSCLTGLD